jgi:glycerophosphoryl diester phosphodiesterase
MDQMQDSSHNQSQASLKKPRWISHRGLKENATENTLRAFRDAVAQGYQDLETDLRLTSDGKIVLSHDRNLERLTGKRIWINKSTADELKSIRYSDGQSILFFTDFIEQFAGQNWIFDVKAEDGVRTLKALGDWIDANHSAPWLMSQGRFLFWSREHQTQWLQRYPEAVCMAREVECLRAGLATRFHIPFASGLLPGKTYAISYEYAGLRFLTKEMVTNYHRKGAKVLAYLPKTLVEIQAAKDAGVDEILCDGPIVF